MSATLPSNSVHAEIDKLLLSGVASTASQAESMFLDAHLSDLASLVIELDDKSFEQHEATANYSWPSRRREDVLR